MAESVLRRVRQALVSCLILLGSPLAGAAEDISWVVQGADGSNRVGLWFFWSERCPHCREALPFIEGLSARNTWLEVHSLEIARHRDHAALYVRMAAALGEEARAVPAFLACGQMLTGFDRAEGIGAQVLALAQSCRSGGLPGGRSVPEGAQASAEVPLSLPVLGEVDPKGLSLPLFTLVMAGLDAFNPCAFFVLLFLLSLMVHARSRGRMLLIGGTFVLVSGLVYFLFMAAWLSLFLVVGTSPLVTAVAGVLAVVIGALNVKDGFLFRQGPTLSIPDGAKPRLFRRVRGLLSAEGLGTLLLGTVTLAAAANSYELLCTAGFPMVYTRVLTLNGQSGLDYFAYLALYNLIYVLPLLAIVLAFSYTLGASKLTERQGRQLKLLSGLMMLGLGLVLLLRPQWLDRLWVGAALVGAALMLTLAAGWVERRWSGGAPAADPTGGRGRS
jgi:hypothetical protein